MSRRRAGLRAGPGTKISLLLIGALAPAVVRAHSFGQVYSLPVPVWLYLYGATAALVLSFLVIGTMLSAAPPAASAPRWEIGDTAPVRFARQCLPLLRMCSLGGLLLCIATGLFGTQSPYGNFNMTFFWIVFALGLAYATVVIGDVYALINPWWLIARGFNRVRVGFTQGRVGYPHRLAYWPALAFYAAFIWLELFGGTTPFSLAWVLLGYSAINLAGVWLVGARDWFRYCEFFGVFFRLIARLAPLGYRCCDTGEPRQRVVIRSPATGVLQAPVESISLLLFILFMLSSTAFDGLHETWAWRRLFWVQLYNAGLHHWVGDNPLAAFPRMHAYYGYWQAAWLVASPLLYLLVYLLFIACSKLAARSRLSVRELALRFGMTLLPIALVYNITHYYTLIQSQGVKIISLASDPFSCGWNLFGTANWFAYTIVPDVVTVWHVQVGLIVAGHIASVYLAHRVALQTFGSRRRAALSQLPMLVLMVLFTTAGLWILAQPVSGG